MLNKSKTFKNFFIQIIYLLLEKREAQIFFDLIFVENIKNNVKNWRNNCPLIDFYVKNSESLKDGIVKVEILPLAFPVFKRKIENFLA